MCVLVQKGKKKWSTEGFFCFSTRHRLRLQLMFLSVQQVSEQQVGRINLCRL